MRNEFNTAKLSISLAKRQPVSQQLNTFKTMSLKSLAKKICNSASKGDATKLRRLLKSCGKTEVVGGYWDRTPLALAAQHGHAECVKILLDYGAEVDAEDIENDTPLSLEAENGHTECVALLLAAGAKVNGCNVNGAPLLRAAYSGDAEKRKNDSGSRREDRR